MPSPRLPLPRPRAMAVLTLLGAGLLAPVLATCGDPAPARGPAVVPYDGEGRPLRPVGRPTSPPNLVVILIDTLRADSAREAMPYLRELAAAGVSFPDAIAPSPWTKPSITSFLTGLPPHVHGSAQLHTYVPLAPHIATFAEILSRAYGYQTAACVDSLWMAGTAQDLLQGFDFVHQSFALKAADRILPAWLRRRDPSRPFFLLLHTFEAHDPYGDENHPWPHPGPRWSVEALERAKAVREPWEMARAMFLDLDLANALRHLWGQRFASDVVRYLWDGWREAPRPDLADELRAAYREGVRQVDGHLRDTVAYLEREGLLRDAILVVTSDHGEAFGEHGILGHGRQMFDELLRVPLVVRGPAPFAGGREIRGSVGLVDVLPTYFDLVGLGVPEGIEGRSLLPVIRGERGGRPVLAEEILTSENTGRDLEVLLSAVRDERWKYVLAYDRRALAIREELFDLAADPGETTDLLAGESVPADGVSPEFCAVVHDMRRRMQDLRTHDVWRRAEGAGARPEVPRLVTRFPCEAGRPP